MKATFATSALHRFMLLLLLILALPVRGETDFPAFTGLVVDEAKILTPTTMEALATRLAEHRKAKGNQVVVVTLASLRGLPMEDFGYQLGRRWGVGDGRKNNGVLFLVAPAEHAARIEVGYGLEGILTDARSHDILQRLVIPALAAGQPAEAITAGTRELLSVLDGAHEPMAGEVAATAEGAATESDDEAAYIGLFIFGLFLIVVGEVIHHFLPERRRSGKVFGILLAVLVGLPVLVFGGPAGLVLAPLIGAPVGWLSYRFHLLLGQFEQQYDVTWDPDPKVREEKRRALAEANARPSPLMGLLGVVTMGRGGVRGGGGSFGGGGASGRW